MLELRGKKHCLYRGFSLLEVLIAIVVFSVGLLGLMNLQFSTLKLQHDSLLRSIATLQASDMADRMRANEVNAQNGVSSDYNNPAGNATGTPACLSLDNDGNTINTQCTSAQMAAHDFYEWTGSLGGLGATNWHPEQRATLPNGQGIVCIDSTPDDGTPLAPACDNTVTVADRPIFAIKVWWTERKDDGASTRRLVMSFTP